MGAGSRMRSAIVLAGFAVALAVAPAANATSFGLGCITNNLAGVWTIGESQLLMHVTAAGSGEALFTFLHLGPLASSIADVYFDGSALLDIAMITSGGGVDFSEGAAPGNLPAG